MISHSLFVRQVSVSANVPANRPGRCRTGGPRYPRSPGDAGHRPHGGDSGNGASAAAAAGPGRHPRSEAGAGREARGTLDPPGMRGIAPMATTPATELRPWQPPPGRDAIPDRRPSSSRRRSTATAGRTSARASRPDGHGRLARMDDQSGLRPRTFGPLRARRPRPGGTRRSQEAALRRRAGRPCPKGIRRSQDAPIPGIRHQGAGSRAADNSSSCCRRLHRYGTNVNLASGERHRTVSGGSADAANRGTTYGPSGITATAGSPDDSTDRAMEPSIESTTFTPVSPRSSAGRP